MPNGCWELSFSRIERVLLAGLAELEKRVVTTSDMRTDNGLAREAGAEGEGVCVFLFIEAQTILGMCRVKGNSARIIYVRWPFETLPRLWHGAPQRLVSFWWLIGSPRTFQTVVSQSCHLHCSSGLLEYGWALAEWAESDQSSSSERGARSFSYDVQIKVPQKRRFELDRDCWPAHVPSVWYRWADYPWIHEVANRRQERRISCLILSLHF